MLRRLVVKLRAALLRPRLEREMREEMRWHLERATERLRGRGLSEAEARAAAQREFGGVDQIEESARDARGGRWVESTLADIRYALRHFRRAPLSTATMLVLLALGIGVNAALFTFLHSVLTQPPPGVAKQDDLVRIRPLGRSRFAADMSYAEVQEYARRTDLFRGVAAWTSASAVLDVGDVEHGPLTGTAVYVTDNYFEVLGVRPVLGAGLPRGVGPASALVGVIGHALWEQHYGGRPDVIGRTLELNGLPVIIVGVAPPRFEGASEGGSQRPVWLPLAARAQLQRTGTAWSSSYDSTLFRVAALLAPGVNTAQAEPSVRVVAARAGAAMRQPRAAASADIVPLRENNERPPIRRNDDVLGGVAAGAFTLLILLITCTNVSTLLIGLALVRRREIAVRLSLGAARPRLIRQLLTESVLLAVAGGALGLLVLAVLIRLYGARIPDTPVALEWPALLFTFGFALLTGLLFGISPALHATRLAVSDVLKDSAAAVVSTRSLLQRGLVVAQIALTQPLLVGLGATVFIILAELNNDGDVPGEHIAVLRFDTYTGNASAEQRAYDMSAIAEQLAATAGVVAAVPLRAGYGVAEVAVHAADRGETAAAAEAFRIRTIAVPAGYFEVMDIPFVRGRDFDRSEYQARNTSIIMGNDLARRLWGNADPIGRRLVHTDDSSAVTVVGVVDGQRAGGSDIGNELRVFVPAWAGSGSAATLPGGDPATRPGRVIALGASQIYVRTQGPAQPMLTTLRQIARATAPQVPVRSVETLAGQELNQRREMLRASMATAAGGLLALFLSAIGLYAVVAFAVGQRTREIGIRAALGAQTREIVNLFFLRGLRLSMLGLAIGLPLSLIALRLLATQLRLRDVNEPLLAAVIAFFVLAVAALATWIPARRAAHIDPLDAIRAE